MPVPADRFRLLTVIDGLGFAGGESRILSMSCGLDRARFEHSVLVLNPALYSSPDEFEARRTQYRQAGIQVEQLSDIAPEQPLRRKPLLPPLYAKTGILRRAKRLASVLRSRRVDAVDSHLESAGLVSVLAGRIAGVPVSMTMYCGSWNPHGMVWPWTTRASLRFAHGVLTDSRIRAEQMQALVPAQRKFAIIPNGIPQPQSSRSREQIRHILGLPSDPRVRVIAQIGRFTEYKGQDVLLRAARRILDVEPNVAFLLVGFDREGAYKAHLQRLAADLKVSDRVVMTGYPGPIGDVWQAVDIHAHASLFDSLPISIAEGMSLSKPAVVTSSGGIPEIVQDEQTGLVVPPGDAEALANALLRLLRDPALARRLGQAARQRYEQRYLPAQMVTALENYFSDLARQP